MRRTVMRSAQRRPTAMARGAGIPRCRRTQARTYALHRDLGGLRAIPLVRGLPAGKEEREGED